MSAVIIESFEYKFCDDHFSYFWKPGGQKLQFLTKTTFYISVGQNSRTMFSKKKQQIVLSLDFSVKIICSNTKKS